jgi:uncharacterized protein (TIGR02231 family)
MKNLLFALFCILSINIFAQTVISSDINSVKIFKNQAEITRETALKVKAGKQEIILTNISTLINPSSLQVQLGNSNITLLSAKYERNYLLPKIDNPKVKKLKADLEILNDDLSWLTDQRTILKGMEDVLNKNQDLGGKSGFTASQVIELSNAYKTKFLEIRKETRALRKQEKDLNLKRSKIQQQLKELNADFNKPSGNIVLQVMSKNAINSHIKCTYLVNNAGWNALYDLRSEGVTKNVQLNYKANVYQNTGQDWHNVKLIISTGNPSQNNNRPILNPLYASIYQVVLSRLSNNTNLAMNSYVQKQKRSSSELEEVVVSDDKDGFKYNATVSTNQLNVEFEIPLKQDIMSDGKTNLIALDAYDLSTTYVYHTVPKISKGAFLIAKISDWGKLNLENGEANIFFEGAYIGKTYINPQVTSKELLVSMGRDNGIIVERKSMKNYASSKFIGSNKKETFAYDIVVKNKKTIPIDIEILDQIPVSQDKQITIDLLEYGSAEYSKDIGKLLWKQHINPGKTITERFVYSVKYPKKETVSGIK